MRTKNSADVRESPTFIEAARRAQIIEAALATIAELGFMNASLAQIANRAGISKSVIGYYFPTKDDLVQKAAEHFYVTGHAEMMATLGKIENPTDLLREYIRTNIAYIDQNRVGTRAINEIVTNFRGPDGKPFYKLEDTEILIEGTAAVFTWGQQTGAFREFDTRVMAVTLRGAIDTFAGQLGMNESLDVEHYIEQLTELFLRAVCANP
ncbi:MAG: TetR/AcrR family transcriptional regulator [bacterium]